MEHLETKIEARIEVMVAEVMLLVREAATEALRCALDKPRRGRRTPAKKQAHPRPRRSRDEVVALGQRLYSEVCRQPGVGMTTLSTTLGTSSEALALPMQHLLRAGQVRKVGQRTRTRYFPLSASERAVMQL